ncbi:mevalonate kinase [Candidatus Gottesmanbacteria bacterium]|nr:mevalonate kinase [Candidatus Gottesmanbacteria bacterium]
MIQVSVPGKVHLMGEHAVVYGKPALLSAVNLRLTVTVEKGTQGIEIISEEPEDYIRHAVEKVCEHFKIEKVPAMKISVDSQIPPGYHLGSSAAVAVGVVGALTYFLKRLWNPSAINQLAYEVEKKMHGNPSGGDNTAVTFGGFLWYRKELEFLRSFWQLPMKLPSGLNHFFLIDTGRPKETTGEMVAFVKLRTQNSTAKMAKLFSENEAQTKRVATAIKEGNEKDLIDAMRHGERTLEGMGVVSKKVLPTIRAIEKLGGAAKILGGGGRTGGVGYLLCYTHNPPEDGIAIVLGEEGIRLEKKV